MVVVEVVAVVVVVEIEVVVDVVKEHSVTGNELQIPHVKGHCTVTLTVASSHLLAKLAHDSA